MKILAVLVLLLPLFSVAVQAEPAPTAGGKLLLKNRSSFSPGDHTRNPFWPIGWVPADPNAQVEVKVNVKPQILSIPKEALSVTTTLVGSPSIAIVNGKEITEKSTLTVNINGAEADLKVILIGDGFVEFEFNGKIIRATGGM